MPAVEPQMFPIERIIRDAGTQMREKINQATVSEYADVMEAGNALPPLLVFRSVDSGGVESNYLVEGFHRILAHEKLGHKVVPVEIKSGTLRDAILHAIGDNATHGLPRTNADKRKAVSTMLCDAEWSKLSDSELARRALVSQPFVGSLRKEFQPPKPAEPATGASPITTSTGSASEGKTSTEVAPTRTVTRGGKTFTMKPGNATTKRKSADKGKPYLKFNEKMKAALTLIKQGKRALGETCEYNADTTTFANKWAHFLSPSIVASLDTLLSRIEDNVPGGMIEVEEGKDAPAPGFITHAKAEKEREKAKAAAEAEKAKDVKAGVTKDNHPGVTSATIKADRKAKVAREKADKAAAALALKPDDEKLQNAAKAAELDATDAADDAAKAKEDALAALKK